MDEFRDFFETGDKEQKVIPAAKDQILQVLLSRPNYPRATDKINKQIKKQFEKNKTLFDQDEYEYDHEYDLKQLYAEYLIDEKILRIGNMKFKRMKYLTRDYKRIFMDNFEHFHSIARLLGIIIDKDKLDFKSQYSQVHSIRIPNGKRKWLTLVLINIEQEDLGDLEDDDEYGEFYYHVLNNNDDFDDELIKLVDFYRLLHAQVEGVLVLKEDLILEDANEKSKLHERVLGV